MIDAPMPILFFGTPEFAAIILRTLLKDKEVQITGVVTQPDRPSGRGKALQLSPVKKVALEHHIPLVQPTSLRRELGSFLDTVATFPPCTLSIVAAFGQILPREVLTYAPLGSINVHASLLPRWRGAAPIHRAIMSGDRETGVALMQMEEGLDTGGIYCETKVPISPSTTTGDLHDLLAIEGGRLLTHYLRAIISGALSPTPQRTEGITYAARITNDEAVIHWDNSYTKILSHIHGLSPFPGAFSYWGTRRLKIFRVSAIDSIPSSRLLAPSIPGRISSTTQGELIVECHDGVLQLKEVQLEGRSRCLGTELLHGHPSLLNSVLSSKASS